MKKIAHIVPWFYLGGIETHLYNLKMYINEYEHHIITDKGSVYREPYKHIETMFVLIGPEDTNRYKSLVNSRLRPFYMFSRIKNKLTYIKSNNYDLVHCHDIGINPVLRSRFFPKLLTKLICDCWIENTRDIPTLFTDHSLFSRYLDSSEQQSAQVYLKLFENIICVEKSGYDNVLKWCKEHGVQKNVWYIPNSVDTRMFSYSEPQERDRLVVGYAARIGREGQSLLEELIINLPEKVDVHIAFGGSETAINEFRQKYGSERVKIFANVPYEKMPEFYRGLDLFFNPIPLPGKGRNTLEAMSCGKPTIMSIDNDRHPIINGKTGFLIEYEINSLLELLQLIINDREKIYSIGRNARKIIEDEYSNDVLIPRLKNVYEQIINEKT